MNKKEKVVISGSFASSRENLIIDVINFTPGKKILKRIKRILKKGK